MRSPDEQRAATRSTWISVVINLVLIVVQVVVGVFAKSQALIADGIHSLSDLVGDVVVLFAAHHANAAADDTHPYGHARFETFASLMLGLLLVATGIGMAVSAGQKLAVGSAVSVHPIALIVAVVTLFAKEGLFRYMRRVGERLQSSMLIANAWHARADAASSLVVALGIGANLLGLKSMDAIAAAMVGFLIAKAGVGFAWNAFRDLTDHALDPAEMHALERTALSVEGVRGLHELRTRRMGDWAVIDAHILVDSMLSVSEGHYIAERVRAAVLAKHRAIEVTIHVDPIDADDTTRLIALPTREQLLAELRTHTPDLDHAKHGHRLHYLDDGVAVEVHLATGTEAKEQALISEALAGLKARNADIVRVSIVNAVPASRQ